ncbi:hypothetical protein DPEC_G00103220 [Dallia pectoralis]|uniref:Uncharacterized protein n=1 Tax=Dallia pectoralis TaxID=75939 RepID=A0ACC2GXD7_DALPE|nr:hypothetical protein DPEC_G00103220 [Dallia pectoralis]
MAEGVRQVSVTSPARTHHKDSAGLGKPYSGREMSLTHQCYVQNGTLISEQEALCILWVCTSEGAGYHLTPLKTGGYEEDRGDIQIMWTSQAFDWRLADSCHMVLVSLALNVHSLTPRGFVKSVTCEERDKTASR